MKNQRRTLFGVIMPAWKEEKLSATNTLNLEFVIQAHFPSKKNKHVPILERNKALNLISNSIPLDKPITPVMARNLANKAIFKVWAKVSGGLGYKQFVKDQKKALQEQMLYYTKKHKALIFPLSSGRILTKFYFKDNYRTDSISKEESIMDILVDAGVLTDDNRFVLPDCTRKARSYKDEILEDICLIKITINKPKIKNPS